jgi:biotin carboxyl carrier protein
MPLYDIKAEISGTILRLDVAVGDSVDIDDQVMTIESMKMEIPIFSPRRGRINSFLVAEGQSVREEQKLATLEID